MADNSNPYAALSEYELHHLPAHLVEAALWEETEALLTDLGFLEVKAEAGLVVQALADFSTAVSLLPPGRSQRRTLRLLHDALRRDVRFIARHPTTLFQCLWNSCWWHDCDEAAGHYELAESEAPGGRLPWQAEVRLCGLLERWREEKGREVPGRPWLRSLRPPIWHLGARGHWLIELRDWATRVAFSPDAKRILHLSVSAPVRVWDVQTAQELVTLLGTEDASAAAFSPDGQRIAVGWGAGVGSGKGRMRLFNAASGQGQLSWQAPRSWIHVLAFSPDGRRVASGSDDGFRIWDAHTGDCLHQVSVAGKVRHLAFSPDGKKLATGGPLTVWDVVTGGRLWLTDESRGWGWGLAFLPGGCLVAATIDQVAIWDVETGAEVAQIPVQDECFALAGSPDGRILTANGGGAVRVWDAQTCRLLLQLPGDGGLRVTPVNDKDLAFSSDGRLVASAPGRDLLIRSCDPEESCLSLQLRGQKHDSPSVTPVPGGGHFLTSESRDGRVLLWDARKAIPIRSWDHRVRIRCLEVSPDGKWAVAGGEGSGQDQDPDLPDYPRLQGWNLDGTMTWSYGGEMTFILDGHKGRVDCLTFSPDGAWIASGSQDQTVRLWNLEEELSWREGSEFRRILEGHRAPVDQLLFCPDSRTLASLGKDNKAILWSVDTGKALLRKRVAAWAFSPDGRWFGALTQKGNVRVWRADKGKEAALLPRSLLGKAIGEGRPGGNVLVFSPDGWRIALHGDHDTITVWDWREQKRVCRVANVDTRTGHLRFSPDGRFLLGLPGPGSEGALLAVDVGRGKILSSAETEALDLWAAGVPPWRAFICDDGRATAIASTRTGDPIAWFPHHLEGLVPVGSDLWVGRVLRSYMCIIALEAGRR